MFRCFWALSRSKPTFLWKNQFELIFLEILLKTNSLDCFMTKSLRKFFLSENLDFLGFIYFFFIQIMPNKNFLSDFVIKQLNLYVFASISWKTSSNWFFQRNVGFKRKRAQTSEHCYLWIAPKRVFRCLSPFTFETHISLEKSVWANFSWNIFKNV